MQYWWPISTSSSGFPFDQGCIFPVFSLPRLILDPPVSLQSIAEALYNYLEEEEAEFLAINGFSSADCKAHWTQLNYELSDKSKKLSNIEENIISFYNTYCKGEVPESEMMVRVRNFIAER